MLVVSEEAGLPMKNDERSSSTMSTNLSASLATTAPYRLTIASARSGHSGAFGGRAGRGVFCGIGGWGWGSGDWGLGFERTVIVGQEHARPRPAAGRAPQPHCALGRPVVRSVVDAREAGVNVAVGHETDVGEVHVDYRATPSAAPSATATPAVLHIRRGDDLRVH